MTRVGLGAVTFDHRHADERERERERERETLCGSEAPTRSQDRNCFLALNFSGEPLNSLQSAGFLPVKSRWGKDRHVQNLL